MSPTIMDVISAIQHRLQDGSNRPTEKGAVKKWDKPADPPKLPLIRIPSSLAGVLFDTAAETSKIHKEGYEQRRKRAWYR